MEPLRHVFGLRHHLGNELAVVAHLNFAEVFGVLLDEFRDPAHDLAARGRRHFGPGSALEGPVGGFDRRIHVRLVALRNQGPWRSCVRIEALERLSRGCIGPPPVEISLVGLELGRAIQHGVFLLSY